MIEASFMLGNKIIAKRMVDEDTLFRAHRNGRSFQIDNHKVVVCGCSCISEVDLFWVEVSVKEVI